MKTPNEYIKNLKKGVITIDMLEDCLYSVNKRAKNYRDKRRKYIEIKRNNKYWYDKYDNIEKCEIKESEYYKKKDILLSIIKPKYIHKQIINKNKGKRIYDYEEEFNKIEENEIIYSNFYYDDEEGMEVEFVDILSNEKVILYFLYYQLNKKSFHSPIDENDINEYPDLDIKEIEFQTFGEEIGNLLSCQFVDKVIALINSFEFKLAN